MDTWYCKIAPHPKKKNENCVRFVRTVFWDRYKKWQEPEVQDDALDIMVPNDLTSVSYSVFETHLEKEKLKKN